MNASEKAHEDRILIEDEGKLFFTHDDHPYLISSHPYEPCLYLDSEDGRQIVIHNAFETEDITEMMQDHLRKTSISGNLIGIEELMELLSVAVSSKYDQSDLSCLEALRILELLKQSDAYGKEHAVDIRKFSIRNTKIMNPLLHSKKVFQDEEGNFYLPERSDIRS